MSAEHLVALPSPCGTWSAWRWAALRATGFPAALVLRLGAAQASAAADQLLDDERAAALARRSVLDALRRARAESSTPSASLEKAAKLLQKGRVPAETGTSADAEIRLLREASERVEVARARLTTAFAEDATHASAALRDVAASPLFREALVWQNRSALETAVAPLLRRAEAGQPRSNERKHEELVASYLQRYCTKNDTIGFFGPVGWAKLGAPGDATAIAPGPALLAHRSIHFEQWPIDALAKKLAADPRAEPWMVPRRLPFVRGTGTEVQSPVTGKISLTEAQATVLAACSGRETAREVAARVVAARPALFGGEADVLDALRTLREKSLVAWTFEVPLTWNPERALASLIARVGDVALRDEMTSQLAELEGARAHVARATGDPGALDVAVTQLAETFTRVTGAAPTRNAGAMYAARQLVFEDCRRDLDAVLGGDVLAAVGPALALVLTSARWMTFEAARVYRERLRGIHDDVLRRSKDGKVPFADVWFRAQRLLFGEKESPFAAVTEAVERRWAELLSFSPGSRRVHFESAALEPRVREAFDAPRPGWCQARHHSPDLMIAAESVEAIARGDYEVVLGEIHVGVNTLDSACILAQHPSPEEIERADGRDLPERLALPVYSKEWLRITARTNRAFAHSWHRYVESGFDIAPGERDQVLSLSDLFVEDVEGELLVRGPDGFALELLAFLGENMSLLTTSALRLLPRAAHNPRVTIDRLVVSRESWRVKPSDMTFAYEDSPESRFLAARRWAKGLGLPRFVFAKSSIEVKPVYVDLDSPIFVNIFAKLVRRTKEHVAGETVISISEMLPGLDQTWVPDRAGARYASELRIVALDRIEEVLRHG